MENLETYVVLVPTYAVFQHPITVLAYFHS